MIQKIIKVGNSLAVTIPADLAKENSFAHGDKVNVMPSSTNEIKIAKYNPQASNVKPWLSGWLDRVEAKYTPLIKKLSNI